jgi:hypothetical protein
VLSGLYALQVELRLADNIECTDFSGDEKTTKLRKIRLQIHDEYAGILQEVKAEVATFVTTPGLNWTQMREALTKLTQQASWRHKEGSKAKDTYAVALSEFLTAIHLYLHRHKLTHGLD